MKNVLIVDDNEQNLFLLETILSGHGYGVTEATNGAEALVKARAECPDLIISDILMPVMDGFELCRQWKQDDRLKDIPFVFYTATYTDSQDKEFALGLGAERFIVKPQDLKTLVSILEEVIADRKAGRLDAPCEPRVDEGVFIKGYNAALIRKLESKMIEVEEANRRLESEMAERVRTEKELRLANERFRRFVDSNIVGIAVANTAGKVIEANDYYLSMIGYDRAELTNGKLDWRAISPQEWISADENAIRELRERGACVPYEKEFIRRDGVRVSVLLADAMLPGPGEEIAVFALDISARKRSDAERVRLMAAIEHAGEMVMVTDHEGTIQYVNPAFEAVTGYSRAESIGKNPRLLKSGKQAPGFYRELWDTISSGKTWTGRIVNRRKDGGLYTQAATISPVLDPAGRIVNYVAVKRDITEQLLLADQFSQAQKMESVGRLAGGVAHDFNNALTPLLVISGMLLEGMDPTHPLFEDIKEMKECGERCANLTRQLLAFSRSQTWESVVLNLNDVVGNMVKMLSRVIGEDIELTQFLDPELGNVKADIGQMEQVLANLAVNARDAMPNGGKLTIETQNIFLDEEYSKAHASVAPGRYVMLAVSDTGVGMDAETRSHIFDPFFTTKEKGKGTGLGLSTVYGIVRQSGGDIFVYSEPGQGSIFKIFLPRVDEKTQEIAPRQRVSANSWRGSETILLVEDEENVRKVAKRILSGKGYKLLEAGSGEQGLKLSESYPEPIHLIVTDVIMPGMGGREMINQLLASRPGVKLLYISGYPDNAVIQHGVLDSGTNYIQKPFTVESLSAKVRKVLDAD